MRDKLVFKSINEKTNDKLEVHFNNSKTWFFDLKTLGTSEIYEKGTTID